ncbi:MAG: hypothetical protein CME63_08345 [Halobacteriovoraceae bacterium]|nr:hypothetical protein [Halobacteriovoraceae bacterium]
MYLIYKSILLILYFSLFPTGFLPSFLTALPEIDCVNFSTNFELNLNDFDRASRNNSSKIEMIDH